MKNTLLLLVTLLTTSACSNAPLSTLRKPASTVSVEACLEHDRELLQTTRMRLEAADRAFAGRDGQRLFLPSLRMAIIQNSLDAELERLEILEGHKAASFGYKSALLGELRAKTFQELLFSSEQEKAAWIRQIEAARDYDSLHAALRVHLNRVEEHLGYVQIPERHQFSLRGRNQSHAQQSIFHFPLSVGDDFQKSSLFVEAFGRAMRELSEAGSCANASELMRVGFEREGRRSQQMPAKYLGAVTLRATVTRRGSCTESVLGGSSLCSGREIPFQRASSEERQRSMASLINTVDETSRKLDEIEAGRLQSVLNECGNNVGIINWSSCHPGITWANGRNWQETPLSYFPGQWRWRRNEDRGGD